MDRDGSCVQGCCKFPLAPTTCAFLAMDRRMDRNGSGWIVRSGLQVDARAAHPERREGPEREKQGETLDGKVKCQEKTCTSLSQTAASSF